MIGGLPVAVVYSVTGCDEPGRSGPSRHAKKPRTCSDGVQGCPAVAEIPISARGWMRARSYVVISGGRGIGRVLVKRLA